jgi:ubiquinone/menaquinone biosynthesis C-methylase UbiE
MTDELPRKQLADGRREGYDRTGALYENEHYYSRHMQSNLEMRSAVLAASIAENLGDARPLQILEVGCGTRVTLTRLSKLPANPILFGVDFSRTMLQQTSDKFVDSPNTPTLLQANAYTLPFDDATYVVVYATWFIHEFPHEQKKEVHREIRRVTRPLGIVVVACYSRKYHWLRYFWGGRKGRSHETYFAHYPTAAVVKDIVREPFELVPLRIGGARVIHAFLGPRLHDWIVRHAMNSLTKFVVDENYVVTRKS